MRGVFITSTQTSFKAYDVMPPYQYSSLSRQTGVIRLLRLLPSIDKLETLRCEIFEYTLRELDTASCPYEALSYCWTSEKKPESITIIDNQKVDQDLTVTHNLYIALLQIRDRELPRFIWADAVCIDQSNDEEKEHQIQIMAAIYAKAIRVIVWLGEAEDDSDQAIESIRIAGEKPKKLWNRELSEQGVLRLLERPWFGRIWILQEVAAARHVIVLCGSAQIDGHAFCLGLDNLKTILQDSKHQITFLIRGAIFRSGQLSKKLGRLSLDMYSLGELFDMYHAYNATKRHDKVYALLGMSSDDLSVAGLEPNYNVSWETLMRNLVRFLLGDQATIETWNDREMAFIKSKCCTLGRVSLVTTREDNKKHVKIAFNSALRDPSGIKSRTTYWTLLPSAKPVEKGDLICILQGAQKPTIIRLCEDYFRIIMIAANPLENIQTVWPELLQLEKRFTRDTLLVWDWENRIETTQNPGKYLELRASPREELEGRLDEAARMWNVAQILGDSGEHEKAKRKEREAINLLKRTLRSEQLHRLERHYGLIPLLWAAENGHNKVVSLIVEEGGVDLDMKDWRGRTPMSLAAKNGHETILKLLLATGKIEPDLKDDDGRTAFSWAAMNGHEAVVINLLKTCKIEVDSKDDESRTPLSWAAENGQKAIFKLLLETGEAKVDLKDNYGRTPLWRAAAYGHEAMVKLLLECGETEVDSRDNYGRTPLSLAAGSGRNAIAKMLLETGKVEIDSRDNYGRTPLWRAAMNGHEAMVKLLLENDNSKVNSQDNYGRTPLWRAAGNGHEAIVKLLLETGKAKADLKDNYGRTPLLWAAGNGRKAVVKILLETGMVEVDSKDNYNRTPLSRAAGSGHEVIVELLLKTGKADVDSKNDESRTPLAWAAKNNRVASVKLLLNMGNPEIDSKDDDGRTPLSLAAGNGHADVVELFLKISKAKVNLGDDDSRTPLSWASGNGHEPIVKMLLMDEKIEVNSKDEDGRTPLSWAAENGHDFIVKLLQPYS